MNYTSFLYKVYIKAAQIHNFCCQSNCCTHLSSWARKNQPEFPTSTKQPEENIVSFVIFPVNNVCSVLDDESRDIFSLISSDFHKKPCVHVYCCCLLARPRTATTWPAAHCHPPCAITDCVS